MKEKVENLKLEVAKKLEATTNLKEVNDLKVEYLGKKGPVQELTSHMKELSSEEKREFGMLLNELKQELTSTIDAKIKYYEEEALNQKLASEKIDVTLPATQIPVGAPNILEKIIEEVEEIELPKKKNETKELTIDDFIEDFLDNMEKIDNNIFFDEVMNEDYDYGYETVTELLEEAYTMDSENPEVALQLLLIVEVDRFVELIGEISDFCANGLLSLWGVESLFRERLYGDDEIEEYYLALLDFLCKHDPESGYCDITKKLLLSIYQFGTYKPDSIQMYVPEFKNVEKAEAFAKKYGMELLDEPFEYLG